MFKNFILFTGLDTFRISEQKNFYRREFFKKYPEGEIEFFDETTEFRVFVNSVLTPNLFGSKRLIFTENFWSPEVFELAEKQKFFEKLPSVEDTSTIISIESAPDKRTRSTKFLLANAKIKTFDPLTENDLWAWIIEYVASLNGKISLNDTKFLISRCGDNLWNLSQEIKKLITVSEQKTITQDLILSLCLPHPKVIIWDFLAFLGEKNTKKAIESFRKLIEMGESPQKIFPMIMREIRIYAQILSGIQKKISIEKIAAETKLHPFVIKKSISNAKNFSFAQIEKMYDALFTIDQKLKTNEIYTNKDDQSELELQIEKFIIMSGNKQ